MCACTLSGEMRPAVRRIESAGETTSAGQAARSAALRGVFSSRLVKIKQDNDRDYSCGG
jgi:hypothetical protein